jgi:hypothetical protein
MDLAVRFITEALPREGVNTLVLEINYNYQFTRRPEVVSANALSRLDLEQLVGAARQAGVKLIPMINLLGHQSWAKTTFGLLTAHPEFDETPGLYPSNEGIYCRSYCPRHPEVHKVVFDLIDELMDATGADTFHAGMDEVFLLGEDACPRCRGANKAQLFAAEVTTIRNHLAARNAKLWIWADRLIDGQVTGIGKWEASLNETAPALSLIPKDVVLNDWHYEQAHPTALAFALQGFATVSSPWRKSSVALRQLDLIRHGRAQSSKEVSARLLGMLQTTWTGFGPFARAYFGEEKTNQAAMEAVSCFRELFRELRSLEPARLLARYENEPNTLEAIRQTVRRLAAAPGGEPARQHLAKSLTGKERDAVEARLLEIRQQLSLKDTQPMSEMSPPFLYVDGLVQETGKPGLATACLYVARAGSVNAETVSAHLARFEMDGETWRLRALEKSESCPGVLGTPPMPQRLLAAW